MARTQTVAEQLIDTVDGSIADASRLTHTETLYKVVDISDNTTTVSSVPALLFGIYVNTILSAATCPVKDNTTTIITLPASWAAGSMQSFPGIRFETSLIVDPGDSETGNITVAYRPI